MSTSQTFEKFGDQTPFCEPYWYQGFTTPYYHKGHVEYRKKCRDFITSEIKPNLEKWIKTGYPKVELHKKLYEAGISGILWDKEFGGYKPDDLDPFYELIAQDEFSNVGPGGVPGQVLINGLAIPPIINFGNQYLKDKVLKPTITGEKATSLAISEPYAGSDVANLQTTAKLEGDYYIINGVKKWITGGLMADFLTTAVRTGDSDSGMLGISLILIDTDLPGVKIRKMETQFDNAHNTTLLTLTNVKVHKKNLIGDENCGFQYIMHNFNHERWVICIDAVRKSRLCYQEAIHYAMSRKTFGKTLVSHQIIRYKLAEMARQIEANHAALEQLTNQFKYVSAHKLGAQCALLKVQCTKTFEYCAREASQIFGGSSIVKEGRGKVVEVLVRETRAISIYGGSEEIMLDFAIRNAVAQSKKNKEKSKL